MSDEKKLLNEDVEVSDDIEMCSIDELLSSIDELENRVPFKQTRNSGYNTSLVDTDVDSNAPTSGTVVVEKESVVPVRTSHKRSKSCKAVDERENSLLKIIFDWVKIVFIAVVIALILNKFVIANAIIPSGSMETTIMTGDRVIGLRVSYLLSEPERGDIVIFKYPDDESKLYIKRIIGLPGDKVEIIDGLVYINDSEEPLDESYLTVAPKGDFGPYQVPEESYFMLGDNRNVSKDSRYWDNTFVKEDKIVAKAYFRYYPSLGIIK